MNPMHGFTPKQGMIHSRLWPRLLVALVVMGLVFFTQAQTTVAAALAQANNLLFVPDDGGIDDYGSINNQSDLSAIGISQNQYGWKWDEASLSGGNTQDVCVYFSVNGADGTGERAVCYQVISDAAGNITSQTTAVYDCPVGTYATGAPPGGQKCSGNPPLATDMTATCAFTPNVTQEFTADPDLDSQAICTITADPSLTLTLVNICTKSGNSPSSSSKDCGLEEAPAFLKLVKEVSDGTAVPADFTLSYNGPDTNDGSVAGNNTQFIPVPPGTYGLSESGPSTYMQETLACSNGDNDGTIVLAANQQVTCIFTNKLKFVPNPVLTFAKSVALTADADGNSEVSQGDTLTYSFVATNNGNVDLTNVQITDTSLPGLSALTCSPTQPATLAPTATLQCTATYVVKATDVGKTIANTASADSDQTPPTQDDATVPVPQPSLTFAKTVARTTDADGSGDTSAGDTLTYSFVATNNGAATLTGVQITDTGLAGLSPLSCDPDQPATLAPTEQMVCTATYVVQPSDVGTTIANTAVANSNQTLPVEDDAEEPVPQPLLAFEKTVARTTDADGSGDTSTGDTLTYSFVATNNGAATLTNVQISDTSLPGLSLLTCDPTQPAILSPGQTLSCTATYVVQASDVGTTIANTAVADSDQTPPTEDDATIPVPESKLELVKSATLTSDLDGNGEPSLGDTLTYSFVATNNGAATLTNVQISDTSLPGLSLLTCTPTQPATLVANASLICTATYVVQTSDVGKTIANTAVADSNQTDPVEDEENVPVPLPSLTFAKTVARTTDADGSSDTSVGDTLTYSFIATNNGAATLTGVEITDTGLVGLSALSCDPDQPSTLAPTEQMVCTATYVVQASDIGKTIANTAVANSNQTPPVDDDAEEPVPQPSLALEKSVARTTDADGSGDTSVGDTLTYSFVATNNGAATLTGVKITDTGLPGLSPLICDPDQPATLAATEQMVCTATYVVQASDVGKTIANTAVADSNQTPPVEDDAEEPVPQPSLAFEKSVARTTDADGNGATSPGDTLTYSFVATNNGAATLTGVQITDTGLTGLSALSCNPDQPATLAPTQQMICTATYVVQASDVGTTIVNVATADSDQTDPQMDDAQEPVPQPALMLDKSGTLNLGADGVANAGDVINYSFTVTNIGGVPLTGVTVTDPKVGTVTCPKNTLAIGEAMVCTGSYTLTQADVNTGKVDNIATADSTQTPAVQDEHTVPVPQQRALTLVKSASPTTYTAVGNQISYAYVVKNTGNVSLAGPVTVSDDKIVSPNSVTCPAVSSVGNGDNLLDPNESVTCTATYTISAADVTAGAVTNTAIASAGGVNSNQAQATVTFQPIVDIEIDKDIRIAPNGAWQENLGQVFLGTTIEWRIVIENKGNVPVSLTSLTDTLNGTSVDLVAACEPDPPATLAAGASYTCIIPGTVTYNNNGSVSNFVSVQACFMPGKCDSDDDTASYTGLYWGFTPGFWKNHTKAPKNAWSYTNYTTGTTLTAAGFVLPGCTGIRGGDTLLKALGYRGGTTLKGASEILLRAAVASLLNASFHEKYNQAVYLPGVGLVDKAPNYTIIYWPYTSKQIIDMVNAALATCNRSTILALAAQLDAYNNGIHQTPWGTLISAAEVRALNADITGLPAENQAVAPRLFLPIARR